MHCVMRIRNEKKIGQIISAQEFNVQHKILPSPHSDNATRLSLKNKMHDAALNTSTYFTESMHTAYGNKIVMF